MDSRINQAGRAIAALRAKMAELEGVIRSQIKRDVDCREDALRLLALRKEVSRLVAEWKLSGGGELAELPQRRSAGRSRRPESPTAIRKRAAELRR
jgi:hypothetical protein